MPVTVGRVIRDVSRLLGANVLARAVGIAALVVYARILSPRDLGALPIFLVLGAFTIIPVNLGLFPTLMREVPVLLEGRRDEALGTLRVVVLTVGGGVVAVALCYVPLAPAIARLFFHDAGAAPLIWWMVPGAVLRGLDEVLVYVLRSTREFEVLARKKLLSELAQPVAAVALLPTLGLRGLLLGMTLGLGIGVAWGAHRARSYLF